MLDLTIRQARPADADAIANVSFLAESNGRLVGELTLARTPDPK